MPEAEQVSFLFADARVLYDDALEQMAQDKLRNAAEKAWGATKRATDALILARTGQEPLTSGQTQRGIRRLRRLDPAVEPLLLSYIDRQSFLHGKCFYRGVCEPVGEVRYHIQATLDYIQTAETLAGR